MQPFGCEDEQIPIPHSTTYYSLILLLIFVPKFVFSVLFEDTDFEKSLRQTY